jgi:hypothetical protein
MDLCSYGFGQRVYFPLGLFFWLFFKFVVLILTILLYCTFRKLLTCVIQMLKKCSNQLKTNVALLLPAIKHSIKTIHTGSMPTS